MPVTIELRVLLKQANGYPVELTLEESRQVYSGLMTADFLPWIPSDDSRVDGQKLFDALFASRELLRGWGAAQDKTPPRRLRLRLDPPELQELPWELLRDGRDLLAADAATPFSRYLPVSEKWGEAVTAQPIRVLAVIANPSDLIDKYAFAPIDVALEENALRESFLASLNTVSTSQKKGPGSEVSLTFLEPPITSERLEQELQQGYHILHIVAHGVYSARRQQAALLLQDADGTTQRLLDEDFADMLDRLTEPPHLVVLAACQSARQSRNTDYSGLGPKLVQIGLPAVVAMQGEVTTLTVRTFTATFYRRLLEHGTIDLAMNQARSVLISGGRPDAALPVLFMCLPDGQLWKMVNTSQPSLMAGQPQQVTNIYNIKGDMVGESKKTTTISTEGGTYFGGNANLSGSSKIVGRDDRSVTVMSVADIEEFFAELKQQIDAKHDLEPQVKEDLKLETQDLQDEIRSGDNASEKVLTNALRHIKRMAPDVLDVIVTTFDNPAVGAAEVVRKVMQNARADSSTLSAQKA